MKLLVKFLLISLVFLSGAFLAASIPTSNTQAVHCNPAPSGTDTDDDCWTDTDEDTFGSNAQDAASTPEFATSTNSSTTGTCSDANDPNAPNGGDNDLDGLKDTADGGCASTVGLKIDADISTPGFQNCNLFPNLDPFYIDVLIDNSNQITGFSMNLSYDPAIAKVTEIDANRILSATTPQTTGSDQLPDSDGQLRVVVTSNADQSTAPSGSGILARIQLTPISDGTFFVQISAPVVNSLNGDLAIEYVRKGQIFIAFHHCSPDPDTDEDGVSDVSGDRCVGFYSVSDDNDDFDGDTVGNACDPDNDNDGLVDGNPTGPAQNPPLPAFPDPAINDDDFDNDGLIDGCFDCASPGIQGEDLNNNGIIEAGETNNQNVDTDSDGRKDGIEKALSSPQGRDTDLSQGHLTPDSEPGVATDPLNPDTDTDSKLDGPDNCKIKYNKDQQDINTNGLGDICDPATPDATVSDPTTGQITYTTQDGSVAFTGTTDLVGSTVTLVTNASGEGTITPCAGSTCFVADAFQLLSPSNVNFTVTVVIDFNPGINQKALDNLVLKKQTATGEIILCSEITKSPACVISTVISSGKIVQATIQFTLIGDADILTEIPADTDGDGIFDNFDLNGDGDFLDPNEHDNCPTGPEDFDLYKDLDGCHDKDSKDLRSTTLSLNISDGIKTSLIAKVDVMLKAERREIIEPYEGAQTAFKNEVLAQKSNGLSESDAQMLIDLANSLTPP